MMFLLELGREPALSIAELYAHCTMHNISCELLWIEKNIACVEMSTFLIPAHPWKGLAGMVKIGTMIAEHDNTSYIAQIIADDLNRNEHTKTLGISVYDARLSAVALAGNIKKIIKKDKKIRFIAKNRPLNAASIKHSKLIEQGAEYMIAYKNGTWHVARTIWAQDVDFWSDFDYGRPVRDARRGMLPPKLAALLLHLGRVPKNGTVLDPFAGTGTIALLAALNDLHAIASDADPATKYAVEQNCQWLHEQYPHIKPIMYLQSDSRAIGRRIKKPVDAIITEPYLGNPKSLTVAQREEEVQRLATLYFSALKDWKKILKPQAMVVMVIPEFVTKKGIISVPLPTMLAQLNYKIMSPLPKNWQCHDAYSMQNNLLYHRNDQKVRREILLLSL